MDMMLSDWYLGCPLYCNGKCEKEVRDCLTHVVVFVVLSGLIFFHQLAMQWMQFVMVNPAIQAHASPYAYKPTAASSLLLSCTSHSYCLSVSHYHLHSYCISSSHYHLHCTVYQCHTITCTVLYISVTQAPALVLYISVTQSPASALHALLRT